MRHSYRRHPRHVFFILAAASAALLAALLLGSPEQHRVVALQSLLATPEAGDVPRPGAGSIGDPYYPWMGNTGYDALHYTIELAVPAPGRRGSAISGTMTLAATATQALSTFNLDFLGFEIEQITVNGTAASFGRLDRELMIIPAAPLPAGERFTVTVAYEGTPVVSSDPALPGFPGVGWLHLSGGIYALNQPSGASTWFPANDHPQDKATYTFRVTVPDPYIVAANGILVQALSEDGATTYIWEAADAMASYLTTVVIAEMEVEHMEGPDGLPIRNYFPIDAPPSLRDPFAVTADQLAFFSELLGPYPFEVYGSLVINAGFAGALETQTLSVFGRGIVAGMGERVLAHELAHQWIGDYVSVETWQDIWINEGFATYAEVLWVRETEGEAAMDRLIQGMVRGATADGLATGHVVAASAGRPAQAQRTYPPPGRPAIDQMFGAGVYRRGGLTFAALHERLGDETFFALMRAYVERYGGGSAGTDEFIAMAEEISGDDLDAFFNAWLFAEEMPALP